jgi:hypothetical protein
MADRADFRWDLREVEWAWGACSEALHDVEVDHGGRKVDMAQQGLHRPDVDPSVQQMRGT